MINKVIISGLLENNVKVELINNSCKAIILSNDGSKEKLKEIEVIMQNKIAKEFVEHQEVYKENLCMYIGEISNCMENNKEMIILITERPRIIAKVSD